MARARWRCAGYPQFNTGIAAFMIDGSAGAFSTGNIRGNVDPGVRLAEGVTTPVAWGRNRQTARRIARPTAQQAVMIYGMTAYSPALAKMCGGHAPPLRHRVFLISCPSGNERSAT